MPMNGTNNGKDEQSFDDMISEHSKQGVLCPHTVDLLQAARDALYRHDVESMRAAHAAAMGHQIACREASFEKPDFWRAIRLVQDKANEMGAPFPYKLTEGESVRADTAAMMKLIGTFGGPQPVDDTLFKGDSFELNLSDLEGKTPDQVSGAVASALLKGLRSLLGINAHDEAEGGDQGGQDQGDAVLDGTGGVVDISGEEVLPPFDGTNGPETIYGGALSQEEIDWRPQTRIAPSTDGTEGASLFRGVYEAALRVAEEMAARSNLPPSTIPTLAWRMMNIIQSDKLIGHFRSIMGEEGYRNMPRMAVVQRGGNPNGIDILGQFFPNIMGDLIPVGEGGDD